MHFLLLFHNLRMDFCFNPGLAEHGRDAKGRLGPEVDLLRDDKVHPRVAEQVPDAGGRGASPRRSAGQESTFLSDVFYFSRNSSRRTDFLCGIQIDAINSKTCRQAEKARTTHVLVN
jgi:hypothetical protein